MRCAIALLACGLVAAEEGPQLAVAPAGFALGTRVDYLLGDGKRPFADDDNRRALLTLHVTVDAPVAMLGYSELAIDAATAGADPLPATVPQDSGYGDEHRVVTHPPPMAFNVGLPGGKAPYHELLELRGHLQVAYAAGEPETWEVAFADLHTFEELSVGGHDELVVAEVDDDDENRLTLRLSPEARLALCEVVFRDATGKDIAAKPPRSDRREVKGKHRRPPAGGRDEVLTYAVKLPRDAKVALRYYPRIERRRVDFALEHVELGLPVPPATTLATRGANDL
jgi:hypothetical protein